MNNVVYRRILGIDPGSYLCGYGVIDIDAKPTYVECGVLRLTPKTSLSDRLLQLAKDLREIIEDLNPTEVALESIYHGLNAQSALKLGHARGVILFICAEKNLPIQEYAPTRVKKMIAGHGRATKQGIQKMVSMQCGLKTPPTPDAADALAIALCHAHFSKNLHLQLNMRKK